MNVTMVWGVVVVFRDDGNFNLVLLVIIVEHAQPIATTTTYTTHAKKKNLK